VQRGTGLAGLLSEGQRRVVARFFALKQSVNSLLIRDSFGR